MATSTNPFAAAMEGGRSEPDGTPHHPNNPFVSTQPAKADNPFAAQISAQQETGSWDQTAGQGATGHFAPPHESSQPAARYESANQISEQLSGLDFTNNASAEATVPPSAQGTRDTPVDWHTEQTQIPSTFSNGSAAPPTAMTTTYAPPPGPPPGFPVKEPSHIAADSGYTATTGYNQADELYARQLLTEEEARTRLPGVSSSRADAAFAPTTTSSSQPRHASPLPAEGTEEKQWNTKEIYWRKRLQRVIIQNENGPCSLIALCNVLLLRGTLVLTPDDRPAVSYSYLSSLLGEHLIDVITTSGSQDAMDLEAALSILPQTQYGLDVNVRFSSIFGFSVDESPEGTAPSSSLIDAVSDSAAAATSSSAVPNAEVPKQRGELALFKLCNVPLVHGWLADEDDKETWAAVVERAGDYDKALDRVVAGDEMAKGGIIENNEAGGSSSHNNGAGSFGGLNTEALAVKDAILIRNFLEATATQLTYPGLYALSTQLQRGVVYALFRNSHLSVLYRPTEEELQQSLGQTHEASDAAQPQLYQLVTDSTLEGEDGIVWESVEDVDGSASRFYDGKFRASRTPQDFVGRQHGSGQGGQVDEDADFAYAQHLQDQESQRARRHQQQQRRQQRGAQRTPNSNYPANAAQRDENGSGNLISRMLANRKASKRAPSSNARLDQRPTTDPLSAESSLQAPYATRPGQASQGAPGPGEEYTGKKDKWYKKIF